MANFFSGMIRGGVLAGVALGTASVLLPARPKLPPVPVATTAPVAADVTPAPKAAPVEPEKTAPAEAVAATPVTAEPVAPATTEPAAAEPATTEPATPAPTEPAPSTPAPTEPAPVAAQPATAPPLAEDALLQPNPQAATTGAKMVAAPTAGAQTKIGGDQIAEISKDIATSQAAVLGEPATPAVNAPPLQKYAASFDDPKSKPLFAVILRDTGGGDVDRAALAALPFPVTFAIDPESENAAQAMAIYRKAGKEVVMLTAGLPEGATAQDLEQSFQTYESVLPETVAIMGPAKGGFQDNAVLSKLIVPVVAGQGRGLITFDRGLNSAAQNAAREGLANAKVFRQFDGSGESVPVMRRYLDRAVFKAAQDGMAMVMGETLPDTITALTEWTIEGKASQVTLAPVSAILR